MWKRVIYAIVPFILLAVACTGSGRSIDDRINDFLNPGSSRTTSSGELLPDVYSLSQEVVESINTRDYGAALEALEALRQHPNHVRHWASYIEAFIYNRLGLYDDALDILNGLNPSPYESNLLELRGFNLNSMNRLDDSMRDFESIDLINPGNSSVALGMMWRIAIGQGNYNRVIELEETLEARSVKDAHDMLAAVTRFIMERDFAAAEETIARIPSLPSVIENPNAAFYDTSILLTRADLLSDKGETDRAIEILIELPNTIPNVTGSWPMLAYLGLALGRFDDARVWAIEGIILSSGMDILDQLEIDIPGSLGDIEAPSGPLRHEETGTLLVQLGFTYLAEGNLDMAMNCAEKALRVNPYEESAYGLLSGTSEIRGDIDSAVSYVVTGLRNAPYDKELALRYVKLADEAPMALGPNDPDPVSVLAGLTTRTTGLYDLYPDYHKAIYTLARLYRFTGEDDSLILFRKASETCPWNVDLSLDYAASLAEAGETESARSITVNLDPEPYLPWLFEIHKRAVEMESVTLWEFATWAREFMDPENRFAEWLDEFQFALPEVSD